MGWYIQLTNERGIDQWLLQVEERLLQPPGCQSRRLLKNREKTEFAKRWEEIGLFRLCWTVKNGRFWRGDTRGGKNWKGETTNGSMREKSRSLRIGREWMLRAVRDLFIHQRKEEKKRGGGFQVLAKETIVPTFDAQSVFFYYYLQFDVRLFFRGFPLPIGWFDILKLYYYHVPMYPSERFVGRPFFFCIQIGSWIKNSIWNR